MGSGLGRARAAPWSGRGRRARLSVVCGEIERGAGRAEQGMRRGVAGRGCRPGCPGEGEGREEAGLVSVGPHASPFPRRRSGWNEKQQDADDVLDGHVVGSTVYTRVSDTWWGVYTRVSVTWWGASGIYSILHVVGSPAYLLYVVRSVLALVLEYLSRGGEPCIY